MIRSNYFDKSVSRETLGKILKYHEFLIENNQKLSLISKSTEKEAIERHYVDCAQIIKYIDKSDKSVLLNALAMLTLAFSSVNVIIPSVS